MLSNTHNCLGLLGLCNPSNLLFDLLLLISVYSSKTVARLSEMADGANWAIFGSRWRPKIWLWSLDAVWRLNC